ncbi:histone-lysine N-methyltransferase 2B [Phoenix dactylifera]|uniref:Histone-lysine N-methyltransferase 2B n=1 Tax=Phoenix dactylifera TaxID=42345 RepID=A0A8B7D3U1_PHODC|nr:histone-lysine N-methyltransferase 2B [Phoenix dactylifera]
MRGLNRLAAAPGRPTASAVSAAYSTFSGGGGGGGGGGGRGRGSSPPPRPPLHPRAPGQAEPDADEDPFAPTGLGHGRGRPVLPSSPVLPAFSSWMSSFKPSSSPAAGRGRAPPPESAGRGRGLPQPPPASADDSQTKRPIFFKREDFPVPPEETQFTDPEEVTPLPRSLSPLLSGSGRGKPTRPEEPDSRASEENRHLRRRAPIGAPRGGREPAEPRAGQPRLDREEAVRKAVEVLSRGGPGGGRGRGGRGAAMRGRGRGGRFRGRRADEAAEEYGLYLGDNADGERLEKKLGEENMKKLGEGFEEMSWSALPSPLEDAYWDAVHTNNMIEFEPEYLVDFDNPDIDEKPPMSLRDSLEKAKPFLMAYEGIKSQEEWEEAVQETMEKVPYLNELIEMYAGPDTVTAKQQQQELERVAKTLPENTPSSVKRFANSAVLTLQSNPGWGWDKKCQFMDKLVWEVSQHYQ